MLAFLWGIFIALSAMVIGQVAGYRSFRSWLSRGGNVLKVRAFDWLDMLVGPLTISIGWGIFLGFYVGPLLQQAGWLP